jgi:hypothetical protein
MASLQRVLALAFAFIPVIGLLTLQAWYPAVLQQAQLAIQPYVANSPLATFFAETPLSRSETPLVFTALTHWSHYEKIAKIAVVVADLGYPVTFVTGRLFEDDVKALHPNITFYPVHGKPDKLTEEEYEQLKNIEKGSVEQELFMLRGALIGSMKDQHETLQAVFNGFRKQYGNEKPLISFYDTLFAGHLPILLGSPGTKPEASIAVSCHPLTLDSNDTFPFHMARLPEIGPDAKAVHNAAAQPEHYNYFTSEITTDFWHKVKELGATRMYNSTMLNSVQVIPDHIMTLGVPEFEFPRSDLRPNIHYFGALPSSKSKAAALPDWWDDVARAKEAGKKIVAVSQGTVDPDLNALLVPTLEALEHRDDVLVIATTVTVDPEEIQGLVVPRNTRIAKFVPYDLLLPYVCLNARISIEVADTSRLMFSSIMAATAPSSKPSNSAYQWWLRVKRKTRM